MGQTILPSGEAISVTPEDILRYLNPDGLRQLLRQERLRWNLKPSKDVDYYDNERLFKYTSELHNAGLYQRMEIRTYPDNGAYNGYAGISIDSGVFGIVHDLEKWNKALSDESKMRIVNRVMISAMANIPGKSGYGLDGNGEMTTNTENRMAAILLDPYDGRIYAMTNDDPNYVNNETRSEEERIPDRAVARIGDIPTRITQLKNDLDFVSDHDYRHTDNSFTNTNRFILDNIDDRTFVYPEISKDTSGAYIPNTRIGLSGEKSYSESDGSQKMNTQIDMSNDRGGDKPSSYNTNINYSGVLHDDGYLPGIFRSLEELQKVDLIDQLMTPSTHNITPGARRPYSFYNFDGVWSSNWFDREGYDDSYNSPGLNPNDMEIVLDGQEPTPYPKLNQSGESQFHRGKLHQWRYNRVTIKYYASDITISIVNPGESYKVGDILRWTFGDDVFLYVVQVVGPNGQIQKGEYKSEKNRIFEQDPSTCGVGIPFSNMSGVGHGAKLAVHSKATIETTATQIKNNLYAYVDITPSVASDNTTPWSDVNLPDSQDGKIVTRSTAAGPAYSGINSGRGGPVSSPNSSTVRFYEHGGNATAGVHVHLFRYVINTKTPRWVERDGIKVYTGEWVDQGPMGVERPCDIKALLFSNPDCNNFNNYYKFMLDTLLDGINRSADGVSTNNKNAVSQAYFHTSDHDPEPNQRFFMPQINPETGMYIEVDITDKVFYINEPTGVMFKYNPIYKNDATYGYGMRPPGWYAIAGALTR